MNTIRVWFTKTGEASYISHLDLQRVMGRAMRRAGLPVWYSLGFNPHIYMTFALPLSLGQESLVESVDFKTETPLDQLDFEGMAAALTEALPRGVDVKKIYPADTDPAAIASVKYQVRLPGDWMKAVEGYNALPEAIVEKKTKRGTKPLNLKEHIPAIIEGPYYKGVTALGASSVDLLFIAKCREEDIFQVQRDMNSELKLLFDANDIGIPFPQVVVNQPATFNARTTKRMETGARDFLEEQKEQSKGMEEEDL